MALTEDDRALSIVANEGWGLMIGDSVSGVTTSFSSKNTGMFLSDALAASFLGAFLARFASVGTRGPEPVFLISTGRATTCLANGLLPVDMLGIWATAGVLELDEGVVEPDLTLTMLAWARKACCAGIGGTTCVSASP